MMREFTALQRLNGILEAPDWIAKAITGRTEDEFVADETLCYVVAQKVTIIGEAVARLSQESRARHSAVPWPDIVGLRNILVHEYFGIYSPLIWQTAADRAPVLRGQVAGICAQSRPSERCPRSRLRERKLVRSPSPVIEVNRHTFNGMMRFSRGPYWVQLLSHLHGNIY